MATASKVHLTSVAGTEYFRPGVQERSAKIVTELLQKNHDEHHTFFNKDGFHNHIAHHLLTLLALRADNPEIEKAYLNNERYQRPQISQQHNPTGDMRNPRDFSRCLGKEKSYHDYLLFFQSEMAQSSWQEVVNDYLFAGDQRANDLLARLFGGFLHPIIHLGFGIEFQQPAIIAEGLAQAAVHSDYMRKLFEPAERAAERWPLERPVTIVELLDEIHADNELCEAPKWSDSDKLRKGILGRAPDRIVEYVSRFRVNPGELQRKTAEMTNAAAHYTAGAQRQDKILKFDFYSMHGINCAIFLSAFLRQNWLSEANKVRLLEWKVRSDLAMYAAAKSPKICLNMIRDYVPKEPSSWDGIEDRVCRFEDDGHASKLVRALAHGQKVCEAYEDRDEFRVKHNDWLQMGHMAIDSVEHPSQNWVRSAGFDEAWQSVPARVT